MFIEGEVPTVVQGNGGYNNGGFFGNDGWWGIILIALLFGWGRNGNGFGGNGNGEGSFGYQLGKLSTTNDVASGFSTSTIMSTQRDTQLAMQQGFADVQQTLCQGFNGINTSILQGFHGVDNAVCTLGYQNQQGFNQLSHQLSDCCCATQRAIDGVNYNNAKNTCDIIQTINCGNQRIIDYMQNEKICALQSENVALKGQISNNAQSAYIVSQLRQPCPVPAYVVPNPNCCYNPCGCSGNNFGGFSVQ